LTFPKLKQRELAPNSTKTVHVMFYTHGRTYIEISFMMAQ